METGTEAEAEAEAEIESEMERRRGPLASSSASRGRIMAYHSSLLQELFFNLPSSSTVVIDKISSWPNLVIQREISPSEEEEEVLPCHR